MREIGFWISVLSMLIFLLALIATLQPEGFTFHNWFLGMQS